MDNVGKSFEDFLNKGFGKWATQYLKEGATFRVLLDKEAFSLSKHGRKMEMTPQQVPEKHDALLEISSSAVKYLCDAQKENDVHERLQQLIQHPTPEKYARMKIEVEPTNEAGNDFYWKGFFFWARRMGFVN